MRTVFAVKVLISQAFHGIKTPNSLVVIFFILLFACLDSLLYGESNYMFYFIFKLALTMNAWLGALPTQPFATEEGTQGC